MKDDERRTRDLDEKCIYSFCLETQLECACIMMVIILKQFLRTYYGSMTLGFGSVQGEVAGCSCE
jgi:hypothetical protein